MIKKVRNILTLFASVIFIVSCSTNDISSTIEISSGVDDNSGNSSISEKTNYEKALEAVSKFDIESTNGYDYSLKQFIGKDEVNSENISLRADFSGNVKAKKDETVKHLNEYGSGEQFTTIHSTTYYFNNMICEYKNDQWKWSNYKKSDYFACTISQLKFDSSYFTSVNESLSSSYVFTANIPDSKINEFLGVDSSSFSDITFRLSISSDFSKLEYFELSYMQTHTRSEMKFEIYRGRVSITLPD